MTRISWSFQTLACALTLALPLATQFALANESTSLPQAMPELEKGGLTHDSRSQAMRRLANEAGSGAEVIDPVLLIESMSGALNGLNYEGIFVYALGNDLTSLHIVHLSSSVGQFERLWALDGEAREVFRDDSLVTRIWPDSQTVLVSKSRARELLPRIDNAFINSSRYRFQMAGSDRVADRPTFVIEALPVDEFRYGLRFWVDKSNHMLLRSMLLDGQQVVEQVLFTSIDFPATLDVSQYSRKGAASVYPWMASQQATATSALQQERHQSADRIRFSQLPAGYREISETFSTSLPTVSPPARSSTGIPSQGSASMTTSSTVIYSSPVSHVMLTDGMASVSVYIEYIDASQQPSAALGLSRMGAVNAYSVSQPKALVTAVGEVPAAAVKAIAHAVQITE